jgi:hypothetical protein
MDVRSLLAALPTDLVDALVTSYLEVEKNFTARKWKTSELDAGHFVEAARRVIEHRLFGSYTSVGTALPNFNDKELTRYENRAGDESYRILIPRVLRAVYGVRNKRGIGHLGAVSANEMDATLIIYNVKWVLAEIVRLESGRSTAETQAAVDRLVERKLSVLWKHEDVVRVIDARIKTRGAVLVHLYDESPQPETALREKTEYRNVTDFRKVLKRLHTDKLIFFGSDGQCVITPNGAEEVERLLAERASVGRASVGRGRRRKR